MSRRYALEVMLAPRDAEGRLLWKDDGGDYLKDLAAARGLPEAEARAWAAREAAKRGAPGRGR